jgi:hypothetical protein
MAMDLRYLSMLIEVFLYFKRCRCFKFENSLIYDRGRRIDLYANPIVCSNIHEMFLVKDVEQLYERMMEEASSISRQHQEAIHRKLGGFYLSLGHFTKYQKFSMKLYKTTGETRFLYWNVVGLMSQAIHATEKSEKQVSLQLARRILERLHIESKILHSEEFLIYLSILEKEGRHEDRLEVIRSPLSHLLKVETDRKLMELSIRLTLRQWGEIYNLCYSTLIDRMDFTDWKFFEGLVTATVELTKGGDRER